jgi:3',5'-cyclic AMP phosphodiesterase CpdA
LRESISSLGWPTYAVPGNHDRRDRMREILPEWCPADPNVAPFLCYTVEKGPVRLVMIDTMNPGSHDGHCLGYAPWSSLWPSVQAALVDFRVRASIVCINWGASLPFPPHPRRGPCSRSGFAEWSSFCAPSAGPAGGATP